MSRRSGRSARCQSCGKPCERGSKICRSCYNKASATKSQPRTFVCQYCHKPGTTRARGQQGPRYHRACYHASLRKPTERTFTCVYCHKEGVSKSRGGQRPRYHAECYAASMRTGRATTPCLNCQKPIKTKNKGTTGLCAACDLASRSGDLKRPLDERLLAILKRGRFTIDQLCGRTLAPESAIRGTLEALQGLGHNLQFIEDDQTWGLEREPAPKRELPTFESDKEGWHIIGYVSDTHLCSVHERLDVLENLYDLFAANGVTQVAHSGNYIDGEKASVNRYELNVHGMDRQLQYLGEHYPQRPGLHTYAVSGDDHEGWYAQREGVDIGRYAENVMRNGGRTDWHDLGYCEAFIALRHRATGKTSYYLVSHPGGGSAYAVSWTSQKFLEALEGGEKPAVGQFGHYHKMELLNIRNVWCLQPGCTQDQTVFARKKKLQYALGGGILWLRQNPDTGAIEELVHYCKQYFNKGYYLNDRWSLSKDVTKVPRVEVPR